MEPMMRNPDVVAVIAKCKKADPQVCQCKQPSMMGATTAMMKQRKDKVKASSGTKTLGTISNMGMSSTPKYGMGTKKVMQDGGPVTPKPML
jgi:NAD(P)H-flavin reductase